MLENLRFNPGEKANDPEFAKQLASLADIYVNDAFGAAHRAHASTEGVTHYLPAYAGLLLAREVETLTDMLADPARPFVAILGGSKVSDKFGVIDRLIDCRRRAAHRRRHGVHVPRRPGHRGRNVDRRDRLGRAGQGDARQGRRTRAVDLVLPVDFVAADAFAEDAETKIVGREEIPADMMGLDIGPASDESFKHEISRAKTIFWNGPMGVFEMKPFETGTRAVAEAISRNNRAVSVVGGGDSVAALKKFDLEDRVTFVSTGGGASMKLLEGSTLPGVDALLDT